MSDISFDPDRDWEPGPCAHCGVAPGEEDDPAILTGDEDRDWVRLCAACEVSEFGWDEEPWEDEPEEDPCDRCGRPPLERLAPRRPPGYSRSLRVDPLQHLHGHGQGAGRETTLHLRERRIRGPEPRPGPLRVAPNGGANNRIRKPAHRPHRKERRT
jgi:hypothetical protein